MDDMSDEKVVVTHVETPEKFFARLASDGERVDTLDDTIYRRVMSTAFAPDLTPHLTDLMTDDHVLAYSTIHQRWCRARVQYVSSGGDMGLTTGAANQLKSAVATNGPKGSARVSLIDFGSVEVVSAGNLRLTTDEIMAYNKGQSFCFECRLAYVKPYSPTREWSSYANYVFESALRDYQSIELRYHRHDAAGVVVCDLRATGAKESLPSMADYLVAARVAHYRMGEDFYHRLFADDGPHYDPKSGDPRDFEWNSDSGDEDREGPDVEVDRHVAKSTKLYYI